jgi:tetratricopeptide (TPR) repeat protein
MYARRLLALGLVALASASCTTTYGEGRKALSQGRYTDAVTHFEEVLEKHPDRIDALLGVGVAKYRAGRYDEALEPLGRAVAREPKLTAARLYLGLAHLRRAEIGPVEEHFKALVAEAPGTRLAAQTERVLQLLRGSDAASDDVRTFMAASLENEYEAAREVAEAQRQARDAELRWRDPFPYYYGYGHPFYHWSRSRR